MVTLSKACQLRVHYLFPSEKDDAEVTHLLETQCADNLPLYNVPDHIPEGYDRIRFAVMKLARRDMVRLRREIETAQGDWRDTLVAAGFANDIRIHLNWLSDRIASD